MGTWNAGLFSNDTTCDVKDSYLKYLKQQLSDEEAYQKTYDEYEEIIGTDEESLFWYAMADTQWGVGRLTSYVKEKALENIQQKGGLEFWEERSNGFEKWEKSMDKLKLKLNSPMPPRKKIAKPVEFVTNPWNVGDVYAYQLHNDMAIETGLNDKYILMQKVGNATSYEKNIYSVIQVFDYVFDEIPNIEVIDSIRILPLTAPRKPNDKVEYVRSVEQSMRAIMDYYSRNSYPKRYMNYIGKRIIAEEHYYENQIPEYVWRRDRMDNWLIKYYLSWQGVEY